MASMPECSEQGGEHWVTRVEKSSDHSENSDMLDTHLESKDVSMWAGTAAGLKTCMSGSWQPSVRVPSWKQEWQG